jgi:hypothetical protein
VGLERERPRDAALVGREAELTALREALAAAPRPFGIVLDGEPGIGKTALWRAGISEAERRRMRLLVASPAESETGLSYAALGDLLAPPIDEVGHELPARQRHALDVALLRDAPGDVSVDPRAIGAGTLAVLRATARDAPVVLAVDDVQWLDTASARALAFALRRLDGACVFVLATARRADGGERVEIGLS